MKRERIEELLDDLDRWLSFDFVDHFPSGALESYKEIMTRRKEKLLHDLLDNPTYLRELRSTLKT